MRDKVKNIIVSTVFLTIIIGFAVAFWIVPDTEISLSERRWLMQLSDVDADTAERDDIFVRYDEYMLDQFPLRNGFRTLKALSEYGLFAKSDNNDIYTKTPKPQNPKTPVLCI